MAVKSTICISWVCFILIFSANLVFCGAPVKYLPGFDGQLPFKLETGYISVDTSELFYYFIETEGNPKEDPLLLWYSGGPGCSAFNGLIYEIGPLAFNITDYEGGLPPLMYYEYGWTKSASILFVDAPVGSGFSYSTTAEGWPTSDTKSAYQTYQFLRKWLLEHPQFLKVQLFIGADSYSGVNAPIIVQHVLDGNKDGVEPHMNLKGYTFGCPLTDVIISENAKITASHRLGLISDELYESAKNNCLGDYITNKYTIPDCYRDTAAIDKLIEDINSNNILDPTCTWASPQPNGESHPRSLSEDIGESAFREDVGKNVLSPFTSPKFWCHEFNYSLSYAWANDKTVQDALHVRNGTIGDWKRCNESLSNTVDAFDTFSLHKNFSKLGLQALIYNGDHDLVVPNIATQEWITNLDLTIVNDWRPWLVDGETAGYTIKYSENGYRLTYATIKGAGHAPQEYKRRECFEMFDRWIHWYPV